MPSPSEPSPSIFFVTPAYRRFELSRVCFEQRKMVIDYLDDHGVSAGCVVIANDENLDIAREFGFDTIERDNRYLGRKFNDGIEFAGRQGATWTVPIGSDSWIDPAYFLPLPKTPIRTRTSPMYAAVTKHRMVETMVKDGKGAGPYMFHRDQLEPANFRPAEDTLSSGIDSSTIRGIGNRVEWQERNMHPLQYIGFRKRPYITQYSTLKRMWGVKEYTNPAQILSEYYPSALVAAALDALDP